MKKQHLIEFLVLFPEIIVKNKNKSNSLRKELALFKLKDLESFIVLSFSKYLHNWDKDKTKKKDRKGAGIWKVIKNIGKKAKDTIISNLKNPALKIFQKLSNLYRKVNCPQSRDLELGELHFPCHNYSGPGTQIGKYPNTKPYNNIDNCSRTHDLDYSRANKETNKELRALMIQKADQEAIDCYDKYPNEFGYSQSKLGIKGKLTIDKLLSELKGKPYTVYGGCLSGVACKCQKSSRRK